MENIKTDLRNSNGGEYSDLKRLGDYVAALNTDSPGGYDLYHVRGDMPGEPNLLVVDKVCSVYRQFDGAVTYIGIENWLAERLSSPDIRLTDPNEVSVLIAETLETGAHIGDLLMAGRTADLYQEEGQEWVPGGGTGWLKDPTEYYLTSLDGYEVSLLTR